MPTNHLIDTEEVIAEALWKKDYPQGGSLYTSYDELGYHDKELYRKKAREYLKRGAVLIPVGSKFKIGDRVEKASGYRFPGIVIGVAQKLDGKLLYLVECIATGAEGMCHIYSELQLRRSE